MKRIFVIMSVFIVLVFFPACADRLEKININHYSDEAADSEDTGRAGEKKYDYEIVIYEDSVCYKDFEEMYGFSDHVITGKNIKVEKIIENKNHPRSNDPRDENPYTISYIEITGIYKTNDDPKKIPYKENLAVGDIIKVTQSGGLETYEKKGKTYRLELHPEPDYLQENKEYLLFIYEYNSYATKTQIFWLSSIWQSHYEFSENKDKLYISQYNNFTDNTFLKEKLGLELPIEKVAQIDENEENPDEEASTLDNLK
jgi:hypothetical protein